MVLASQLVNLLHLLVAERAELQRPGIILDLRHRLEVRNRDSTLSKINWTPCTTLVRLFASTDNLNPVEATESYDQCMPILISECVDLDLHACAFCFFDFLFGFFLNHVLVVFENMVVLVTHNRRACIFLGKRGYISCKRTWVRPTYMIVPKNDVLGNPNSYSSLLMT